MTPSAKRDSIGTSTAFALGGIVGVSLAVPAIPAERVLFVGSVAFGPAETALLLGAIAVLSLPPLFVVLASLIQPGS